LRRVQQPPSLNREVDEPATGHGRADAAEPQQWAEVVPEAAVRHSACEKNAATPRSAAGAAFAGLRPCDDPDAQSSPFRRCMMANREHERDAAERARPDEEFVPGPLDEVSEVDDGVAAEDADEEDVDEEDEIVDGDETNAS
jgi:hypothetical protein